MNVHAAIHFGGCKDWSSAVTTPFTSKIFFLSSGSRIHYLSLTYVPIIFFKYSGSNIHLKIFFRPMYPGIILYEIIMGWYESNPGYVIMV